LTREQAAHLLYKALFGIMGEKHVEFPSLKKGGYVNRPLNTKRIRFLWDEPCILKPAKRWSGKQILSMVLKSLLRFYNHKEDALFHSGKSETPGDSWNGALDGNKEEEEVCIRGTELLRGILDKTAFGAKSNGLVHVCYEIFGPEVASRLLSVFAKLFTAYLQMTGFTCAMSDFLVDDASELVRSQRIKQTHFESKQVLKEFVADQEKHLECIPKTDEWKMKSILFQNPNSVDILDRKMLGKLSKEWGDTISACLPHGQRVPFPKNCFACMIQTGAKGSKVHHSQISCIMGQQELEGRRVPFLATRRSLPSFAPFDYGARAGGYIVDRFLTGFRPQEYFFHCMAGREGLVDTAVKTSRSGYLQRCLVKHLETLVVGYDYTVRDVSDQSVVQFAYGEDGCEVVKSSTLTAFKLHEAHPDRNSESLHQAISKAMDTKIASKYGRILTRHNQHHDQERTVKCLKKLESECEDSEKMHIQRLRQKLEVDSKLSLDPVASVFPPARFFGSTSEAFARDLDKASSDPKFRERMQYRYQKALCAPGEAVGVITGQSMGEPCTQMTLNTFHLAGHGGANVTLGIPRLREIVQTASKRILTPTMQVFLKQTPTGKKSLRKVKEYAHEVAKKYCKTMLKDVVRETNVKELMSDTDGNKSRTYTVKVCFEDMKLIESRLPYITKRVMQEVMCVGGGSFAYRLSREVKKLIQIVKKRAGGIEEKKVARQVSEEKEEKEGDIEKEEENEKEEPPKKKRRVDKRRTAVGSDVDDSETSDDSADSGEENEEKEEDEEKEENEVKEENDMEENDVKVEIDDAGDTDMVNDGEEFRFIHSCKFIGNECTLTVVVNLIDSPSKILLAEIVSMLLESTTIQDPIAKGLDTLHVREEKDEIMIETEGINMEAFWALPDGCVCLERMYTNCIATMLSIHGIEACRQAIVREVRNVFNHYGIEVNYRHLFLIADYMTHHGGFRACNRIGMQDASSPFLQMSYETSMNFCTKAAIEGLTDSFKSPTSSIIIGEPPHCGSNSFDVYYDLEQLTQKKPVRDFIIRGL